LERTPENPDAVRDFRIKYGTVLTLITVKLMILILDVDDEDVFIVNILNRPVEAPRRLWGVTDDFLLLELRDIINLALSSQSYKMMATVIYSPSISESK
jgi:hypothetical protein